MAATELYATGCLYLKLYTDFNPVPDDNCGLS